jgi:glycosyltransferase involved in cell wall biosynthesis
VLQHWQQLTMPNVIGKVRRAGFGDVDLLIVDTPPQHFWFDAIRHRRSVIRVTDFFGGFQKATPAMLDCEREMIQRADAVLYTARNLQSTVEEARPRRARYVPNGISVHRFKNGDRSLPGEYAGIPAPRVVYVGAIEEWFDIELVAQCATTYPHVSFVIIGPPRIDLTALAQLPNVHCLGARAHKDVPKYLWNADVGIIPFDAQHPVIRSVHPIKLYEYIACDLPVVTMQWEELEEIPLVFHKAANRAAFVADVGVALAQGKYAQPLERFSWRRTAECILDIAFQ